MRNHTKASFIPNGLQSKQPNVLLKEMIGEYLLQLSGRYAPGTIRNRRHRLACFVRYLESAGINTRHYPSREEILGYQRYLKSKGRKTLDYEYLQPIKHFYAYLKKEGRILIDPFSGIEVLAHSRGKTVVPSEDEVLRILSAPKVDTAKGLRDRALLELLYSTGIRREEASKLMIYDLDGHGGYLKVDGSKNKTERVVPIGRTAMSWVTRYISEVREQYCRGGEELFISVFYGRRLAPATISHIVRKNARAAGLKRFSAHALRHACASHMLKNGADIRYIKEMLGHKRLSTTEIYTHVSLEDLSRVQSACHPREVVI